MQEYNKKNYWGIIKIDSFEIFFKFFKNFFEAFLLA